MGYYNARGVWVVAPNDDLIQGWETMASQLGTYMQIGSTEAAGAALTQAETAGMGATVNNPLLFLVGSGVRKVAYTGDGSKTSGKWNLAPLNETDTSATTFGGGREVTVAWGVTSWQTESTLTVAPYDRAVLAVGNVFGKTTAGIAEAHLYIGGTGTVRGRFDTSNADQVPLVNLGRIPANTPPVVKLGVTGVGSGTNKVQLSEGDYLNRLAVLAFPVSMAV